jgi:hypothetical protein
MPNETPEESDQTRCPNCYGPLPDAVTVTATGVLVCGEPCARGWMNGEATKKYLETVRRVRSVLLDTSGG